MPIGDATADTAMPRAVSSAARREVSSLVEVGHVDPQALRTSMCEAPSACSTATCTRGSLSISSPNPDSVHSIMANSIHRIESLVVEKDAVARAAVPGTVRGMVAQLATLGLPAGATVIVHASLSRLGWVAGGAQAVVTALLEAVGPGGTLVMPTHSRQLTEPSDWGNPAVPQSWWDVIRSETPAFDPRTTPTYFMGAVVECFRRFPGSAQRPPDGVVRRVRAGRGAHHRRPHAGRRAR